MILPYTFSKEKQKVSILNIITVKVLDNDTQQAKYQLIITPVTSTTPTSYTVSLAEFIRTDTFEGKRTVGEYCVRIKNGLDTVEWLSEGVYGTFENDRIKFVGNMTKPSIEGTITGNGTLTDKRTQITLESRSSDTDQLQFGYFFGGSLYGYGKMTIPGVGTYTSNCFDSNHMRSGLLQLEKTKNKYHGAFDTQYNMCGDGTYTVYSQGYALLVITGTFAQNMVQQGSTAYNHARITIQLQDKKLTCYNEDARELTFQVDTPANPNHHAMGNIDWGTILETIARPPGNIQ